MSERSILGFDRRCRVCGKWVYLTGDLDPDASCAHCGKPYGRLALGEDVPRRKNPAPKMTKAERAAIKTAKLAKAPAKGQYGYRGKG